MSGGNVEEVTPSNTLVKYYNAGGLSLGLNTTSDASGSGISYLANDSLGSVSEALNQTGTATGAQLYDPYGNIRYSTGSMPTTKGFTGQYSDAGSTGLDYYGARYYDVALGQFTTADTAGDGLNRYGYVKGNPETYTDPTGHRSDCQEAGDCGGGGSGGSSNNGGGCHSDRSCGCYSECGGNTSNPNACHLEAVTCQAINNTFHNSNTRIVLYMLLQYSVIGWEFLPFILAMGKALGDAYITWTGKNGPAYTTGGGVNHDRSKS